MTWRNWRTRWRDLCDHTDKVRPLFLDSASSMRDAARLRVKKRTLPTTRPLLLDVPVKKLKAPE